MTIDPLDCTGVNQNEKHPTVSFLYTGFIALPYLDEELKFICLLLTNLEDAIADDVIIIYNVKLPSSAHRSVPNLVNIAWAYLPTNLTADT